MTNGTVGWKPSKRVNKGQSQSFLHSYGKVKSNLHVLDDGCTYYWTVYLITQIDILVINCILVCKLYISYVDFTKSHHSSKIGITLSTAKFPGLTASKTYSQHFLSLWGHF